MKELSTFFCDLKRNGDNAMSVMQDAQTMVTDDGDVMTYVPGLGWVVN